MNRRSRGCLPAAAALRRRLRRRAPPSSTAHSRFCCSSARPASLEAGIRHAPGPAGPSSAMRPAGDRRRDPVRGDVVEEALREIEALQVIEEVSVYFNTNLVGTPTSRAHRARATAPSGTESNNHARREARPHERTEQSDPRNPPPSEATVPSGTESNNHARREARPHERTEQSDPREIRHRVKATPFSPAPSRTTTRGELGDAQWGVCGSQPFLQGGVVDLWESRAGSGGGAGLGG